MHSIANQKLTTLQYDLNFGGLVADNWITTAQAADALGITRRQILKYIKSGKLPAQRIGFSYVINKSDLAKISKRKRRPSKTDDE